MREGESFKILLGNFLARLVLARNSVYVDSFMAMKGKDFVGKAPRQNAVLQRQSFYSSTLFTVPFSNRVGQNPDKSELFRRDFHDKGQNTLDTYTFQKDVLDVIKSSTVLKLAGSKQSIPVRLGHHSS